MVWNYLPLDIVTLEPIGHKSLTKHTLCSPWLLPPGKINSSPPVGASWVPQSLGHERKKFTFHTTSDLHYSVLTPAFFLGNYPVRFKDNYVNMQQPTSVIS